MSALKTPAPDAPAEQWGEFAVSIPGWRWPDGMHWAAPGFVASWTGSIPTNDVRRYVRVGSPPVYPDPDHWAWWGWLVRMLGPYAQHLECRVRTSGGVVWRVCTGVIVVTEWLPLGRAAIAAAASVGRWPGGEE